MQVSDSPPPDRPDAAGKDEVRGVGDEAGAGKRSRPGRGFRAALERKNGDGTGGADATASAAAMAGWFRPEPSPGATPSSPTARVAGVSAARAVDRVLIGSGPDGAEARIRIGAGALAGTEIQLSSSTGGRVVEAQLLTHTASSRQTLFVVLDDIRSRLRERGIVLSTKESAKAAPRERR